MKPCQTFHHTPDSSCRLCWLADHDDSYRALWEITSPKPQYVPFRGEGEAMLALLRATPQQEVSTSIDRTRQLAPPHCSFEGEELTGYERQSLGKSHTKKYKYCLHPDKPLGNVVCSCTGCGPQCRGYPKDLLTSPSPPIPLALPPVQSSKLVVNNPPTLHNGHPQPTFPSPEKMDSRTLGLKWVYGVTTVPSRRDDLLPRTLLSLKRSGFEKPHLFVDGAEDQESWRREFDLNVTCRYPKVRTAGNWVLSLYELYYRDPTADRFALFQDDLVCLLNLRTYLDRVPYPPKAYLNLFTAGSNQDLCPQGHIGFYKSNQMGKGALALVFDRPAVMTLLSAWHLVERVQDPHRGAYKAIDGGVLETMKMVGYTEMVHNPSLVEHTGDHSAMGNLPHRPSRSFPGEKVDALSFLPQHPVTQVGG